MTLVRRVFACALSMSLVIGSLLPYMTRQTAADPDGVCGPILVLEHRVVHIEAPLPASTDHCVFCHLWHAMAGASVAAPAVVAPPIGAVATLPLARPERAALPELHNASPRGPPPSASL